MSSTIKEKREQLKALSIQAKAIIENGDCNTINEGIIILYSNEVHQEFHTLKQWNEKGFKVRRGEKAFLIWGKPKKGNKEAPATENKEASTEENESNFFPIAFLFSNAQVEPMK